jgi:hypothetical protein
MMMVRMRILGADLEPGSDVSGSMILTVDVNTVEGRFEIDTTCTDPGNHLLLVSSDNVGIVPDFTKGLIDIGPPPDNYAPIAHDDNYYAIENILLTVGPPGVLENDTDADDDPLTVELATNVSHGNLTLNPDGSLSYMPDAGFTGTDQFTYRAYDGSVYSHSAAIARIDVHPAGNGPPVAVDDAYSIVEGFPLVIPAPGVLENDIDADGDPLTVELGMTVAHGSLTLNPDGRFTYVPVPGFRGVDVFSYRAFDGHTYSSEAATVQIMVNPNTGRPMATNDLYVLSGTHQLVVPAPGVLSNDFDPFGETMYAVLDADVSHGTLELYSNGSFTYTAGPDFVGLDHFTYHVFAGVSFSTPATVMILAEIQAGPPTPIEISFDIKPRSCPNPLNANVHGRGNTGVLPVAIIGSADFDVTQINLSTIRVAGLTFLRSSLMDVSGPIDGSSRENCECLSSGPDGHPDLTMKFDKRDIVDALGPVDDGEEISLEIQGRLYDETEFYGIDCVTITGLHNERLRTSNHPNPFNASTTIAFTVHEDADVRLRIFDLLGRHVATLVDGYRSAGNHEVVWDGRSRSGDEIPSGIYFYQLQAGSASVGRKIVLLK